MQCKCSGCPRIPSPILNPNTIFDSESESAVLFYIFAKTERAPVQKIIKMKKPHTHSHTVTRTLVDTQHKYTRALALFSDSPLPLAHTLSHTCGWTAI